jgi:DNA-binding IclR family transcriptional regulator
MGTIFKAWGTPEEIDDWLDRMAKQFDGDRASQLAAISSIRARGYSLGSEQDFNFELEDALRRLNRQDSDRRALEVAMMVANKIRNYKDATFDDSDHEPVNYLVGPVFDRRGRVVMSVNLFGKPKQITRRDLPRLGPELLATTEKITALIGGIHSADVAP